jgi:predicted amidohydrolase YtcJ
MMHYLTTPFGQNIHAIGDRANGIVLDAFESALQGLIVSDLRPRLEHAQILTPEHIQRIASLGCMASFFRIRTSTHPTLSDCEYSAYTCYQ